MPWFAVCEYWTKFRCCNVFITVAVEPSPFTKTNWYVWMEGVRRKLTVPGTETSATYLVPFAISYKTGADVSLLKLVICINLPVADGARLKAKLLLLPKLKRRGYSSSINERCV